MTDTVLSRVVTTSDNRISLPPAVAHAARKREDKRATTKKRIIIVYVGGEAMGVDLVIPYVHDTGLPDRLVCSLQSILEASPQEGIVSLK
jgi:hypothetical protein